MSRIAQVVKKKERKESDTELIQIMLNGNSREREQAYAELYHNYIEFLTYFFAKSVRDPNTVSDLAIDSIGKAFKNIRSFNSKYAFSTWMQRIARNTLIDYKRKQVIEVKSFEDLSYKNSEGNETVFEIASTDLLPDETLERSSAHTELKEKLQNLKPRYKTLIEMRFMKELSYNEIAKALNSSVGTIKAQIFRAKDALALQYEE